MKLGEYRKQTTRTLTDLFGDEAGPLCDILLCSFLDTDKSEMLLRLEEEVSRETVLKMDEAVNELGLGLPVQYVIGSCWFFGLKIYVGKGCFIPRSDTEILVKTSLPALPPGELCHLCGNRCISAAISQSRPDVTGYALELSYKALKYTEENLKDFPNVKVKRFDVLDEDDYHDFVSETGTKADVIVCNPPYIRSGDILLLQQQVQYEPHEALDGGEDGLKFYRRITVCADYSYEAGRLS